MKKPTINIGSVLEYLEILATDNRHVSQLLNDAINMIETFEYDLFSDFDSYKNLVINQLIEVLKNPDLDSDTTSILNWIQKIIKSTVIEKDQNLYVEKYNGEFSKESLEKFLIDCIGSGEMKPYTKSVFINLLFVFDRLTVTNGKG
jgi:hypothetical protein